MAYSCPRSPCTAPARRTRSGKLVGDLLGVRLVRVKIMENHGGARPLPAVIRVTSSTCPSVLAVDVLLVGVVDRGGVRTPPPRLWVGWFMNVSAGQRDDRTAWSPRTHGLRTSGFGAESATIRAGSQV